MSLADDISWWEQFRDSDGYRRLQSRPVAYFCAEFALTSRLKTYSGGLGVLAGDIVREAAAQKLPLVGVGLFYDQALQKSQLSSAEIREHQIIDKSEKVGSGLSDFIRNPILADGSRFEPTFSADVASRPENFGLELVLDRFHRPITVTVPIQDRQIKVAAYRWPPTQARSWWSGGVRTAPVYLLTTDCPDNDSRDCCITDRLYPADKEKRLQQEIILGLGGLRLLEALGIHPSIYHLNEGHSAFLALEIIRHEMSERMIGFDDALELARRHLVFTNHTLVTAGQDVFSNDLVAANLAGYAEELAVPVDRLVRLGLVQESSLFSITMLSLRLAGKINAVSQLHAVKAAAIWTDHPMAGITNGIHLATWDRLREVEGGREAGMDGERDGERENFPFPVSFQSSIPTSFSISSNHSLWHLHLRNKLLLLAKIKSLTSHDWPEDCLLIGWARRFVGYKRPLALFFDPVWLKDICTRPGRPAMPAGRQVRLVISGNTHEGDAEGEKLLEELHRLTNPASQPQPHNSISDFTAYLPNYDMELAQLLTAGCDVWLNTPVVGFEACGTSGMKAALNGVLPISTKDGWMAELDQKSQLKSAKISYHQTTENSDKSDPIYPVYPQSDISRFSRSQPTSSGIAGIGWLIDSDKVSDALYQTLENQVIPLYFDNRPEWLNNMSRARQLILQHFTTTRVLKEYVEKLYLPILL